MSFSLISVNQPKQRRGTKLKRRQAYYRHKKDVSPFFIITRYNLFVCWALQIIVLWYYAAPRSNDYSKKPMLRFFSKESLILLFVSRAQIILSRMQNGVIIFESNPVYLILFGLMIYPQKQRSHLLLSKLFIRYFPH